MSKYNIKTINQDNDIKQKKKALCFYIGSKIRILESTENELVGIEGYVVDETKNSIKMALDGKKEHAVVLKQKIQKMMLDGNTIDFEDFMHGQNLKSYNMKPITERIKKLSD